MVCSPEFPSRRSIRLSGYDSSQEGAYFITICVQNRENRFGQIAHGIMHLNQAGEMIDYWWKQLFEKFNDIEASTYVIMPNHLYGIVHIVGAIPCNRPDRDVINEEGENKVSPLQIYNSNEGLGRYISWFKRMSTNEYIRNIKENNWPRFEKRLWQRNYYEHIIRNEKDLQRIQEYIVTNPANWEKDELFISQ